MLADEDIPLVLPLVMEHLCPKAVALFGLGAVAAAVMSSVDSAVLSSSGQFSRNVYKRIIRKTVGIFIWGDFEPIENNKLPIFQPCNEFSNFTYD